MNTSMKRCSRGENCLNPLGCELPATSEYFSKNKHKRDGFCTECKICTRAHARNYAKAHPEKVAEGKRRYAKQHPERIKQSNYKWMAKNPDKVHEYRLNTYWRNPEKYRAKSRSYSRSLSVERRKARYLNRKEQGNLWQQRDPEAVRQYNVDYYHRNKASLDQRSKHWRLIHPDEMRERGKRFRAKHPDVNRAKSRKRYSEKHNLPFRFSPELERRMFEYWDYTCAICGRRVGLWLMLAADHWIAVHDPRPDNPGTVPTNMIPLCHGKKGTPSGEASCNVSKHDGDPEVWLIERYGKSKARQILKRINAYFDWVREQDG